MPFEIRKFKYANDINKKLSELQVNWVDYNILLGKSKDNLKQVLSLIRPSFIQIPAVK